MADASAAEAHAEAAGLRYSTHEAAGYSRRRQGRGFSYRDQAGKAIRDRKKLSRMRALAIPPAWSDVWISPHPLGHLQATGRDARGRRQYLYHRDWRKVRDADKFDRMLTFGKALPRVRQHVDADLRLAGLPRERVLAAVVRLVDETLIRVGNEEYRRANGSFGATTLRRRDAQVEASQITVEFRGKGGKLHHAEIADRRLARTIQRLQELPGRELFEYLDGGERRSVRSEDVNAYIREASGEDLTVKDFRTWGASSLCMHALSSLPPPRNKQQTEAGIKQAIAEVAEALGNTPAVCKASYVHPAILDAFATGQLAAAGSSRRLSGLDASESQLLRFLRANVSASRAPGSERA